MASGTSDLPAIRQKVILQNLLGLKGQHIFQTLITDDPCLMVASATLTSLCDVGYAPLNERYRSPSIKDSALVLTLALLYNCIMEYGKGSETVVADAFSCLPVRSLLHSAPKKNSDAFCLQL